MKLLITLILFFTSPVFAANVLFIGDSQSAGPFGKTLDQLLRNENHVVSRAVNGSVGGWWKTGHTSPSFKWNWGRNLDGSEVKAFKSTPILSNLVEQNRPDFVILQFGGNYAGWSSEKIQNDLQPLIDTVKKTGAKCMFVTGPDTYVNRDLLFDTVDRLENAIGDQCTFFNSVAATCYPDEAALETTNERDFKADGRHYNFLPEGEPLAIEWAQRVYADFEYFKRQNSLSSD